ncbi:MAG: hypothetical protein WCJ40_04695 [Planctomycetota bacterium]
MNNFKQIGFGLHNSENANNCFPPASAFPTASLPASVQAENHNLPPNGWGTRVYQLIMGAVGLQKPT